MLRKPWNVLALVVAGFKVPPPDLQDYDFHEVMRVQDLEVSALAPAWTKSFHLTHFMEYMSLFQFPKELEDVYEQPKELGNGAFGVTFLATSKSTGCKVAVKLLLHGGEYIKAEDYFNQASLREWVEASQEECRTAKAIHEADSLDVLGSQHVVKCLHDGISEEIQNRSLATAKPLYIIMEFAGTDDVEKWWGKMLKEELQPQEYVQKIQMMTKGMMAGLRFLGESKTDRQWIHHDLKPPNMVYNEEKDSVVLIDLGAAMSSDEVEKVSAADPRFRPPEKGPFLLIPDWLLIGWAMPIWSFDAFSAAATVLAAAGPFEDLWPSLMQLMFTQVQVSMANVGTMKQLAAAEDPAEELKVLLIRRSQEFLGQRLAAVRAAPAGSDARMSALASLALCRSSASRPYALQAFIRPLPVQLQKPTYLWMLLADWIDSGFDEVLLQMLDPDPGKRPKPSTVLANEWFTRDQPAGKADEVEITCPEIGFSEFGITALGCISAAVLTLLCSCSVVAYIRTNQEMPFWKFGMSVGGILTSASPWLFFYVLEWQILWVILFMPLGVLMSSAPWLTFAQQAEKQRLGIIGTAILLRLVRQFTVLSTQIAALPVPHYGFYQLFAGAELVFGALSLLLYTFTLRSLRRPSDAREAAKPSETELFPVVGPA